MKITTKTAQFSSPLYLESGRILEPYEITYETYGELNEDKSNVILVCHALSGSHHAAGVYENEQKAGWWDGLIGDGKAIDTTQFFVICTNVVGSCFGSTGPMSNNYPSETPYRLKFPVVTVKDMVRAQMHLLSQLGIYHVRAVVGGSMGGMQVLQWSISYPDFVDAILCIASTTRLNAQSIAFDAVGRNAILGDSNFDGGQYHGHQGPDRGLAIARMIATSSNIKWVLPVIPARRPAYEPVILTGSRGWARKPTAEAPRSSRAAWQWTW